MANTVTYKTPTPGITPTTALVAKKKNKTIAIITGDGAATTFTITHNWNVSVADRAAGFPIFSVQNQGAGGAAGNPFFASQTADAVTFTCTAFTGALIQITLDRPFSMDK